MEHLRWASLPRVTACPQQGKEEFPLALMTGFPWIISWLSLVYCVYLRWFIVEGGNSCSIKFALLSLIHLHKPYKQLRDL